MNEFQHDGTHSRLFESMGITKETIAFGGGFSFDVVATFLNHALREHAQVPDHGNTISQDRFDHREAFEAAFDFNGIGTRISKKSSILTCECGSETTAGRKIAGDEGFFCSSGDGSSVVKHFRHGDRGGIRIAEYDHTQGISDKDKI